MNCKKIKRLLSAYLDRELDPKVLYRVEQHLASCPSCRNDLVLLEEYKKVVATIDHVSAPSDIVSRVRERLNKKERVMESFRIPRQGIILLQTAAVVAAILVLAIILVPMDFFRPAFLVTDYSLQVKKQGKGPGKSIGERAAESVQLQTILGITEQVKGKVMKDGYNPASGATDYVTVRIRKKAYPEFRSLYNQDRHMDTLSSRPPKNLSRYVDIQVYFPGRVFVSGDFNGDGYTDVLAFFRQGRNAGKWAICLHLKDGNFSMPGEIPWRDSLNYLPDQSALLSGDLNGDRFDDLLLQFRFGTRTGQWFYYLNDGKGGFLPGKQLKFGQEWIAFAGINTPLAGDMNGDGLVDIGAHYRKGEKAGQWIFSLNKGEGTFTEGSSYAFNLGGTGGEAKYIPFVLDFNGDGRTDAGVYWPTGPLCAKWFVSLNTGDNTFSLEIQVAYAFCGNYTPYPGDFNKDGFGDFCIKTGSPDEIGDWNSMINLQGEKFVYGSLSFGGNKDFMFEKFAD